MGEGRGCRAPACPAPSVPLLGMKPLVLAPTLPKPSLPWRSKDFRKVGKEGELQVVRSIHPELETTNTQ